MYPCMKYLLILRSVWVSMIIIEQKIKLVHLRSFSKVNHIFYFNVKEWLKKYNRFIKINFDSLENSVC